MDVVVVSYQSRDSLRDCVIPLAGSDGVSVAVVDNASSDGSLDAVRDLPVTCIESGSNGGFAFGCNIGAAQGSAPYVLFLNPDAHIDRPSLDRLVEVLDREPGAGLAAPRIVEQSGEVAPSQRRFPRLRSTFAQALFLHRLAPEAPWVDELIREPSAYERAGTPDWVSGACMLVRRDVLEAIGGLDEGYFLYCEDTDLCYRVRQAGYDIRFEPTATAFHQGGASRPSSELRGVLATSRLRYARMRHGRWVALAEAVGIALGETTHLLVSLNRPGAARGHAKALRSLVRPGRPAIHARGSAV